MLSKQTQHFLSSVLRVSSHVKFHKNIASVLPQTLPPHALTHSYSLYNFPRSFFSNSSKDDDSNGNPPSDEKAPKTKKPRASKKAKAQEASEAASAEPVQGEAKEEPKKLVTVPLKAAKFPLEKGEESLKQETYVFYSSSTPVIPFSQQSSLEVGALTPEQLGKKFGFFLQSDSGEIFKIGLVLESNQSKVLKEDNVVPPNDGKGTFKAEVIGNVNYKIKLTEIEFHENCIYVKGIPYKDSEPTEAEKDINVPSILGQIKNLTLGIRQSVSHEKIDAFNSISFELIFGKKIEPEKLDELLYSILAECQKIANYTKENFQPFIQSFLEQRSQISRMFMIKKKLEEMKNVLEIVNKSIQHADEQIWKFHEQAKARLSLDYIRSNYFTGESPPGKAAGAGVKGPQQTIETPLSGQAQKFMEKLHIIPDEVSRDKVKKEIERFSMQDKMSGEFHKMYTYLDEVFSIPWNTVTEEIWNISQAEEVLTNKLFGLELVKKRIIEMISVNKLKRAKEQVSEKKKGFVILLNGPPGTGKTTIAKSIAAALKRESRFISFAGVTDPSFVKGHKRTYVDAQPGIFVKELIKSKVMNPVFILDEVDKLSKHFQGVDPYYALMEILNPEENHNFTDHYLDLKVDFSQVIFILTSNQALNMLEPLRNRLEVIEVPAYIEQEKLSIAKKYLIPAVLAEHALPVQNIHFDDETISKIIKGWCYYESGVRELRRCFEKIARKHSLNILNLHRQQYPQIEEEPIIVESHTVPAPETTEPKKEETPQESGSKAIPLGTFNSKEASQLLEIKNSTKLILTADENIDEKLKNYLGSPVFDDEAERKMRKRHKGTANVLTVSGFIGHVMTVECVFDLSNQEKKGGLTSSGNLQKVLQESLTIARIVAFNFLPEDKVKEMAGMSVHVHFLQGGTPKDGPSAGVSICSALLSLMLNKPIPSHISMTGELSLNGDVCKIGGVQAKVTASKTLGINTILLPWGNKNDFSELPDLLKEGLTVYFVKEYQEVFNILFGESVESLQGIDKFVGPEKKEEQPAPKINIPSNSNAYVSMEESQEKK